MPEEANDALQAAEGSLGEASRILVQLRELAVQGSKDMASESDREALVREFDAGRQDPRRHRPSDDKGSDRGCGGSSGGR